MRIQTQLWMRCYRVPQLGNVQFSMKPVQKNDKRDPNVADPLMDEHLTLQCDCCGTYQRFVNEPYEGSGWTHSDGPNPDKHTYCDNYSGENLFEVDLCAECSEKHDVSEFDHLPRTGCYWCWERFPKSELVAIPGGCEESVCKKCAAKIKRCNKCERLHLKDDFAKDKKSRDGFDYTCKYCRADARQTPEAKRRDAARKRRDR